jgi:two-component sensor histidine kinase
LLYDHHCTGERFSTLEAERLLRQRAALADFGAAALASTDLDGVLAEGARLCAEGLGVPYCRVLEYRPGTDDLVVRAGVGWRPGVIGRAVARADNGNPGGRAFRTGRPVIVADLRRAEDMDLPGIYARHGIVSAASVPTLGKRQRPFGVLEVGAREPHGFGEHDLGFLRGFAKVMARAARAHRRHAAVRAESEATAVLLREQQHRVRNNLMAITAMLRSGERGAADEGSRAHFGGVRRRVFAMASLYDHLLGAGLSGDEASLRDYLGALCAGARDFHGLAEGRIALAFEAGDDAVPMGIDACTVLGIVVNEVIANAVEHAFGRAGRGRIAVALGRGEDGGRVVTVEDDGTGVPPGAEAGSLGLRFARKLLEQVGASLTLRSAPGRTVWTVALPDGAQG